MFADSLFSGRLLNLESVGLGASALPFLQVRRGRVLRPGWTPKRRWPSGGGDGAGELCGRFPTGRSTRPGRNLPSEYPESSGVRRFGYHLASVRAVSHWRACGCACTDCRRVARSEARDGGQRFRSVVTPNSVPYPIATHWVRRARGAATFRQAERWPLATMTSGGRLRRHREIVHDRDIGAPNPPPGARSMAIGSGSDSLSVRVSLSVADA